MNHKTPPIVKLFLFIICSSFNRALSCFFTNIPPVVPMSYYMSLKLSAVNLFSTLFTSYDFFITPAPTVRHGCITIRVFSIKYNFRTFRRSPPLFSFWYFFGYFIITVKLGPFPLGRLSRFHTPLSTILELLDDLR